MTQLFRVQKVAGLILSSEFYHDVALNILKSLLSTDVPVMADSLLLSDVMKRIYEEALLNELRNNQSGRLFPMKDFH